METMIKKFSFINLLFLFISVNLFAQNETYDIATFTIPTGWTREVGTSSFSVIKVNNTDKTWCRIIVYKSITSKGTIEQDFNNDWKSLVYDQYKTNEQHPETQANEADGWKILSGAGTFTFNGSNSIVLLTTLTGFGKTISLVALTNSQSYMDAIDAFMSSVDLKIPGKENINVNNSDKNIVVNNNPSNNALKDKYAFNTTNFDDGWTSTVQADWVEVTKGNLKVLIHYPKEGTIFPADPDVLISAAWNILVAPRYSNIKNYKVAQTITDYERGYLGSANLTDNKTGKSVFVALFRKGSSGWLEFICPDKNTFINSYGFDPDNIRWDSDSKVYDPLVKMVGYNKFAIASSDFPGKWSNKFANNTYYANIYTGMSAGMSTYTSSEDFEFSTTTYKWSLVAANSYGGNTNFASGKSSGNYKVLNNWQIYFSDIEKKPKTYDAYFSCIKGARILWLQDKDYPTGYTSYGRIE
ncbi:MAG: hypothetical protein U0W24_21395 [Bacteroidales bacterium]